MLLKNIGQLWLKEISLISQSVEMELSVLIPKDMACPCQSSLPGETSAVLYSNPLGQRFISYGLLSANWATAVLGRVISTG
jgi:hypothetical protein